MLFFRADPQMAVVHQKLSSMFLRRDRVIVDILQDLECGHIDLNAERRPRVLLYRTGNNDRTLLADRIRKVVKRLVIRFEYNALHNARAVAELQKYEFSARTFVIKPALE